MVTNGIRVSAGVSVRVLGGSPRGWIVTSHVGWKGKVQRIQYLLAVDLDCYITHHPSLKRELESNL